MVDLGVCAVFVCMCKCRQLLRGRPPRSGINTKHYCIAVVQGPGRMGEEGLLMRGVLTQHQAVALIKGALGATQDSSPLDVLKT